MSKFTRTSLYILTEGHTEEAYFSRISEILGDDDDWTYAVTVDVREIIKGSKTDPYHMVMEAKKSRKKYDEVWVVFDKDRDRDEQLDKAFEEAAKSKIGIAYSSIAFEHWVLLHYERCENAFFRSDCESRGDVCECNGEICISTYIKQQHYGAYVKGKAKLYDHLEPNQDVAIENAAWLKHSHEPIQALGLLNPYTDVHALVIRLLQKPLVVFLDVNSTFDLAEVQVNVQEVSREGDELFAKVSLANNAAMTFLVNNAQENIRLVGADRAELGYTVEQAQLIAPGESLQTTIKFVLIDGFEPSALKFIAPTKHVFVNVPIQ